MGARSSVDEPDVAGYALSERAASRRAAPDRKLGPETDRCDRLWQETSPDSGSLDHNSAQLVGETDARPRAHTDSKDCRYAGVLYLSPGAPEKGGTTFYRLRHPMDRWGATCVRRSTPIFAKPWASPDCRPARGRKTSRFPMLQPADRLSGGPGPRGDLILRRRKAVEAADGRVLLAGGVGIGMSNGIAVRRLQMGR